jgi:hypothetical protein
MEYRLKRQLQVFILVVGLVMHLLLVRWVMLLILYPVIGLAEMNLVYVVLVQHLLCEMSIQSPLSCLKLWPQSSRFLYFNTILHIYFCAAHYVGVAVVLHIRSLKCISSDEQYMSSQCVRWG